MKGQTPCSFHRKGFAISSRSEPDINKNPSTSAQHILLAALPFHNKGGNNRGSTWVLNTSPTMAGCKEIPQSTCRLEVMHTWKCKDQDNLKKELLAPNCVNKDKLSINNELP